VVLWWIAKIYVVFQRLVNWLGAGGGNLFQKTTEHAANVVVRRLLTFSVDFCNFFWDPNFFCYQFSVSPSNNTTVFYCIEDVSCHVSCINEVLARDNKSLLTLNFVQTKIQQFLKKLITVIEDTSLNQKNQFFSHKFKRIKQTE
jgi:hypothetical protein